MAAEVAEAGPPALELHQAGEWPVEHLDLP
jgi:hypothetical protein